MLEGSDKLNTLRSLVIELRQINNAELKRYKATGEEPPIHLIKRSDEIIKLGNELFGIL